MRFNRKHALVAVLAVFLVASLSGCAELRKSSAAIADGAGWYCENNIESGRLAIRQQLHGELVAEGIELCLGCPGDTVTSCAGVDLPKAHDGGEG